MYMVKNKLVIHVCAYTTSSNKETMVHSCMGHPHDIESCCLAQAVVITEEVLLSFVSLCMDRSIVLPCTLYCTKCLLAGRFI